MKIGDLLMADYGNAIIGRISFETNKLLSASPSTFGITLPNGIKINFIILVLELEQLMIRWLALILQRECKISAMFFFNMQNKDSFL